MLEFVEINEKGAEVDWVSPVEGIADHGTYYVVNNGYFDYKIKTKPGHTYLTRLMGDTYE